MKRLLILITAVLFTGCATTPCWSPASYNYPSIVIAPSDESRMRLVISRSCDDFIDGFKGASVGYLKYFPNIKNVRTYTSGNLKVLVYSYGDKTILFAIKDGRIIQAKCSDLLLTDEGGDHGQHS